MISHSPQISADRPIGSTMPTGTIITIIGKDGVITRKNTNIIDLPTEGPPSPGLVAGAPRRIRCKSPTQLNRLSGPCTQVSRLQKPVKMLTNPSRNIRPLSMLETEAVKAASVIIRRKIVIGDDCPCCFGLSQNPQVASIPAVIRRVSSLWRFTRDTTQEGKRATSRR